ncbi:MAG: hypothetical protein ACLGXA_03215 [Acidobacteriota bacterium]
MGRCLLRSGRRSRQSAYRKLGRTADADRELAIYKNMKAQSRERIAEALKQHAH